MAEDKNDSLDNPDVDVVDAEIIEDNETSEPPSAEPKTVHASSPEKTKGGKTGWIVAGLLAAFSGGLFAAPYAEYGLRTVGLLPALPSAPAAGSPTLLPELTALETQVSDLALALDRHQEILAQHEQSLGDAAIARTQLGNDVALIAGQQGAATADSSPADIEPLRDRVAALTDEVARLAALSGGPTPEVAGLTGSVALARAEAAQLKTKLEALEAVVAELQAGSLDVSPRGRMLVAIGRLKDQASRGMPLGGELTALRADIALMPALDQQMIGADVAVLARHPEGVRPYEALVRDFGGAASAAKRAQEQADGSLLANLFTVRRTDEGATGIDAILLEAERRLLARDVAGALDALQPLTGPAAEALAMWRAPAEAHVDVMGALDRLQRAAAASPANPAVGGGR